MSPKEKAQELFSKYNRKGLFQISNIINRIVRKEIIKQCVIIAIDELINHSRNTAMVYDLSFDESENYWAKVKQEIKKL